MAAELHALAEASVVFWECWGTAAVDRPKPKEGADDMDHSGRSPASADKEWLQGIAS